MRLHTPTGNSSGCAAPRHASGCLALRRPLPTAHQRHHVRRTPPPAAAAAGGTAAAPAPQQQDTATAAAIPRGQRQRRQQQQQTGGGPPPLGGARPQQQRNAPIRSRQKPPQLQQQPFLVRIAGRTSSVAGAAGAIVKRLSTDDMVRVAAIDANSVAKALVTLTAANNMALVNAGRMLVFQPTVVRGAAAEPPRVPEGSLVMYTTQVMAGEVMAFNTMIVRHSTDVRKLAAAITSRMQEEGHTVLECFGPVAVTTAVLAAAEARRYLLKNGLDLAVVITSRPKPTYSDGAEAGSSSAAGGDGAPPVRGPLCHRLVLLECAPRKPRALLVSASMGVSDRARRPPPPAAAAGPDS